MKEPSASEYNVLLIGGRGNIGSGLRTYLPRLDPGYRLTSIDLPGAVDRATGETVPGDLIDLDILEHPDRFRDLVPGRDLVVYLARHPELTTMNGMTDLVFDAVLAQERPPMLLAASSVHAVDEAYHFFREGTYALIAARRFDEIAAWPAPIPVTMPACPINDYGWEKAYVEERVKQMAEAGHDAIAARWGGINARNSAIEEEDGYFSVWCHQEDAARFVHACFMAHQAGTLRSGAHYFVISDNTYNIFDIGTAKEEIGYTPVHNAESFYA